MLLDCEVFMTKSDWRSIRNSFIISILVSILGTEYQICRLSSNDKNIEQKTEPTKVESVSINDTLSLRTIQYIKKVVIEVQLNEQ